MGILSASQGLQCFGGSGYCDDYPLELISISTRGKCSLCNISLVMSYPRQKDCEAPRPEGRGFPERKISISDNYEGLFALYTLVKEK
jgi:hypothetical protein